MPQRTWRQGLHQAIEAKEGIEVSDPSETLSRLSFQRFFRFFHKLSGMTGTASEASKELWHIYNLPVIKIPTNRPCIRKQQTDKVFFSQDEKWDAVEKEILELHRKSSPILVGTRSVEASENLAKRLTAHNIEFNLLNAINHKDEARIIAEAGNLNKITISTNMAGRGTDIILGKHVSGKGGLVVLATERHESGRIDRQLFGRSARQGDPGVAQAFISLDDELFQRFLPKYIVRSWLIPLLKLQLPGYRFIAYCAVQYAQYSAQKQAYKQRKNVMKMDSWMEESLSFAKGGGKIY